MRYCSYDARKVVDHLTNIGIIIPGSHYFDVELAVGTFWPNHITDVIDTVLRGRPDYIERAQQQGWPYFAKPVWSMLPARGCAHRVQPIEVDDTIRAQAQSIYNVVATTVCVADFNMKELALLLNDIATMPIDVGDLSNAAAACRKQNSRSIYYLHGVLRRDIQSRQGRAVEIQEEQAGHGPWQPPADFETLDAGDRAAALLEWEAKQRDMKIMTSLNRYAKTTP